MCAICEFLSLLEKGDRRLRSTFIKRCGRIRIVPNCSYWRVTWKWSTGRSRAISGQPALHAARFELASDSRRAERRCDRRAVAKALTMLNNSDRNMPRFMFTMRTKSTTTTTRMTSEDGDD